jgi:hypothetical protein
MPKEYRHIKRCDKNVTKNKTDTAEKRCQYVA